LKEISPPPLYDNNNKEQNRDLFSTMKFGFSILGTTHDFGETCVMQAGAETPLKRKQMSLHAGN